MAPYSKPVRIESGFLLAGLCFLLVGLLGGTLGILQYMAPAFWKDVFSFEKVRPIHVSGILFWILLTSVGAVLSYMGLGATRLERRLSRIQLLLLVLPMVIAITGYTAGIFGGREYWEFPPVLLIPIIAGWLIFIVRVIRNLKIMGSISVYRWMWMTGAVAFLFTLLESMLWLIPWFRSNIVRDMTVQWKSYGSMVGAWNMLIYGGSIFLMEKISGDTSKARSKASYALYFTSLTNLLFNWGHHIYTLPTVSFIQPVSYVISMTELVIFAGILINWKKTLAQHKRWENELACRFLSLADWWILLNLALALAMSVPAINIYTHGTHITVAHAMGTTIGINSFLLLASCVHLLEIDQKEQVRKRLLRWLSVSHWLLLAFWIELIAAGIKKGIWQQDLHAVSFAEFSSSMHPLYLAMGITGTLLALALIMIIIPVLKWGYNNLKPTKE